MRAQRDLWTLLRMFELLLLLVLLLVCTPVCSAREETTKTTTASSSNHKARKICTIEGGLDIARLTSANVQRLFQGALEDVELIREYVSEAAFNGGIQGGLHHDLDQLARTLDWQARNNLNANDTTVTAGLGHVDDREDRRVERYVSLLQDHQPFVGTKQTDLAMIDAVSNLFPWIVDRQSQEDNWFLTHQNGRSPTAQFDRLYIAA